MACGCAGDGQDKGSWGFPSNGGPGVPNEEIFGERRRPARAPGRGHQTGAWVWLVLAALAAIVLWRRR